MGAIGGLFALALGQWLPLHAAPAPAPMAVVLQIDSAVEVSRFGAAVWDRAYTNQMLYAGDQLRTGEGARATLRMSDQTLVRLGELSRVQMPAAAGERSVFTILKGLLYFFHRDRPGDYEIRTRTVSAIVRGTEFNVEVTENDGTTLLSLLDGAVQMTNDFGALDLNSGQQAIAQPGQVPRLTPVLTLRQPNLIQWCLYYPGMVYVPDLDLSAPEAEALRLSLAAYQSGDLVAAYRQWPTNVLADSDATRLFHSAVSLAVGKVDEAERLLETVLGGRTASAPGTPWETNRLRRVARAMRDGINLVRAQGLPARSEPRVLEPTGPGHETTTRLATEWLVESLIQQKAVALEQARSAARQSVQVAPDFAFGWVRVAELEFGFGRVPAALVAVEKGLSLAPRHAAAHALKGFLLAARHRLPEAEAAFAEAIALDGNLDDAWLGRGLVRIRTGRRQEGRQDLQTAATLNPGRAVLRSYLGKAYENEGDTERALRELMRGMSLDENDPTAWLYSALLKQQENRVNDAIEDLEKAQELNQSQSRGIVRSRLLLDQDRAVAGANLASVYLDAGMSDVSLREAVAAVNADYTSFRSHLFLANSYNALRDPYQINLRYETPWLSEYLVSTLLAPVGAGVLSPYVSQQEYSRLFEGDHVGVASATEFRSNGDWQQTGVQYGTIGATSYALDANYRLLQGFRPNQGAEQLTLTARFQQQLTPADSVFAQAIYYDANAGDVAPHYGLSEVHRDLRAKESQQPLLVGGYHHQWSEQSHTLLLGAHFQDTYQVRDTQQPVLEFFKVNGDVVGAPINGQPLTSLSYRGQFDGNAGEAQQLWRQGDHTLTVGGRFQGGTFQTRSDLGGTSNVVFGTPTFTFGAPRNFAPSSQRFEEDFLRATAYGYYHWQALESVLLSAGLVYDHLEYPRNFRNAPISAGQTQSERLLPKAGLIWNAYPGSTVRAAYTRSLGGVAFDQSFRLEPSQVAGFNQSFRSLIPESVAGSIAGARLDTLGVALDQKLGAGTYFGMVAEELSSKAARDVGAIDSDITAFPPVDRLSTTRQRLDYHERNLAFSLNQLVGRNWSFGARYRLTDADLKSDLISVPSSVAPGARGTVEATLHTVDLYAMFRHECGFFGQLDSVWVQQSNRRYQPDIPGDDFWQFNAMVGWSFFHRRLEAKTGVLNLTGRNYRLNPLNLAPEYPRERTWVASLKFYF